MKINFVKVNLDCFESLTTKKIKQVQVILAFTSSREAKNR